jgi:hypothetical protein
MAHHHSASPSSEHRSGKPGSAIRRVTPSNRRIHREITLKRLVSSLLVWTLAAVLLAQAAAAQDDAHVTPVPGVDEAMVRFVHASPNAGTQLVVLRRADGAAGQRVSILEYREPTDYLPVPEGRYEVLLDPAALTGEGDPPVRLLESLRLLDGRHYTVVIVGLAGVREGADEGIVAWLEDLFTSDQPELGLQALVLEDPTMAEEAHRGVDVRLVHAAPGTEGVELVLERGGGVDILATARYLDVSEFTRISSNAGSLALRLAGGGPVLEGLGDLDTTPGAIHTIVLAGTPLEAAPLAPIVVTHHWIDPLLIAPTSPGPVPAVVSGLDADQVAWVTNLLVAVETWLDSAEDDLAGADASDAGAAALEDLAEARRLLESARAELAAAAGEPLPDAPPPAADPDERP